MPSGRTHDRITLYSFPLLTGLVALATQAPVKAALFGGGFLFSGFMFGPDLDIHSLPYKRWGPMRWIWLPYRQAMSHRSMLSHGPLLGTVFRILYLASWLLLFCAVGVVCWAQMRSPEDWQQLSLSQLESMLILLQQWLLQYPLEGLLLFLGLEAGAMSHAFSDWTGSSFKSWRRKRLKRVVAKRRKQR
jgi:uncharacterized metal-binding protein